MTFDLRPPFALRNSSGELARNDYLANRIRSKIDEFRILALRNPDMKAVVTRGQSFLKSAEAVSPRRAGVTGTDGSSNRPLLRRGAEVQIEEAFRGNDYDALRRCINADADFFCERNQHLAASRINGKNRRARNTVTCELHIGDEANQLFIRGVHLAPNQIADEVTSAREFDSVGEGNLHFEACQFFRVGN